MSERAGRNSDVVLMTSIVAGTTTALVLFLTRTPHAPWLTLAALGAVAAAMSEIVVRGVRPEIRFADTAAAVVIAGLMAPGLTRWGGPAFDRDALFQIVVGVPLGIVAAGLTRRGRVSAAGSEALIGVALTAAAVGVTAVLVDLLGTRERGGFLLLLGSAGLVAGLGHGLLVRRGRAGHVVLGAMVVFGLPRTMHVGLMRAMAFDDMCVCIVALAVPAVVGFRLGRRERARTGPVALPEARIHDSDAGDPPPVA